MECSYQEIVNNKLRRVSEVLAGIVLAVGIVVFFGGWYFDVAEIRTVLPGLASMKANTAVVFSALSSALLLTHAHHRGLSLLRSILAAVGLIFSSLTLMEYLTSIDFGIDQIFFSDVMSKTTNSPLGRMAPNTAIMLTLSSIALLALHAGKQRVADATAMVAGLIALIGLLGFAFDVRSLYGVGAYTTMAIHTAGCGFLLSIGTLCAHSNKHSLINIVTRKGAGGLTARHLLPAAFAIPAVLGMLCAVGIRQNQFGPGFALALFCGLSIVGFAYLIWRNSITLDELDNERLDALDKLKIANETLETRVAQRTAALEQEISDREHAEQKIRGLLESAPDGIVICDELGKIVMVNAQTERLFSYQRQELIGQSIEILLPEEKRGEFPQLRADFAENPTARTMGVGSHIQARRKDGSELPVSIGLSPIKTEHGLLIFCAIRDVSQQRENELRIQDLNEALIRHNTELTALNRDLEAFSYSVSHDLRAPLRAIDGFGLVLAEECANALTLEGRDALERIRAAARTMGALIDDLIKLSRVSRAELQSEPVDLSVLAHDAVQELEQLEPERKVTVNIANENMVVMGDSRLMRVVLNNLIGNAWKFTSTRPSAEITFGIEESRRENIYYIRDNGVGFDMRYADKLFGAFQRLHDTREFPGTGIGLATVQRIINRHGGRIWALSQLGNGATFYFTLKSAGSAKHAA